MKALYWPGAAYAPIELNILCYDKNKNLLVTDRGFIKKQDCYTLDQKEAIEAFIIAQQTLNVEVVRFRIKHYRDLDSVPLNSEFGVPTDI